MDVRECLRPAIDRKGFRYQYVATEAGFTDQQLSDVMNKRRRLEANEFVKICAVIGMSPDEVLAYGVKAEADKEVG